MTEYDNTNSGALFGAADAKIVRKGPVNIQGDDNELSIVQVTSKEGKKYFEVYQKVGAIFTNDEKRSEDDADMSGDIDYKGLVMKIWGRKKESKNGVPYTSISLAPKQGDSSGAYESPEDDIKDDLDDDIPF